MADGHCANLAGRARITSPVRLFHHQLTARGNTMSDDEILFLRYAAYFADLLCMIADDLEPDCMEGAIALRVAAASFGFAPPVAFEKVERAAQLGGETLN